VRKVASSRVERLRVLIGEGKGGEGTIYGGACRRSKPRCQASTPEQSSALLSDPRASRAVCIHHFSDSFVDVGNSPDAYHSPTT
jgi:hypothetical protein